jgi:hypothetical protein
MQCHGGRVKWITTEKNRQGEPVDLALVDLAVVTDSVIGARAIWDVNRLRELFLTRAQP